MYCPADSAGIAAVKEVELVFVTEVAAVRAVVVAVSTNTLEDEKPAPVIVIFPAVLGVSTPEIPVSYTHLRAHETREDRLCPLLL